MKKCEFLDGKFNNLCNRWLITTAVKSLEKNDKCIGLFEPKVKPYFLLAVFRVSL